LKKVKIGEADGKAVVIGYHQLTGNHAAKNLAIGVLGKVAVGQQRPAKGQANIVEVGLELVDDI
jgi:hypothetical protein